MSYMSPAGNMLIRECDEMKRSTLTLATGLILTAAALKLAFPSRSQEVITTVKDTVSLSQSEKAAETVSAVPVTVTINAAEFLGQTEEGDHETIQLPPEVEEAVETFLTSQEPYSELAVPADVSYDVILPDFICARPVSAPYSSGFGYRVHPLENLTKFHYGADLAAQSGDDIHSFASGTVTEVGQNESFGNFIRIAHPDGYETFYAHCGTIYVTKGQSVSVGEKIGLVGSTGKTTGPHLHFELKKDGIYMNPAFYLAAV